MDYNEGDIATNPETGHSVKLTNGQWVPVDAPHSFSGDAKALMSGIVHEGIPGALGTPGDVRDLINSGGAWLANKIKGTAGTPDEITPAQIGDAAGSIPGLGAVSSLVKKLPTSAEIKSKVEPYIGAGYEPQNFAERALKTTGSLLPAVALGPAGAEEAGASLMAKALGKGSNALANTGRYAVVPALASEGVREGFDAVGANDSPYKEPAAMAALLVSPLAAAKLITPNAANVIQRAAGKTLDNVGATYTPKQLSQGNLERESQALGLLGGNKRIQNVNTANTENFNRGTLKAAFGDTLPNGPIKDQVTAATKITPELRQQITQSIDDEFNRLAASHSMPLDTRLEKQLDKVIQRYKDDATLRVNKQPMKDLAQIKDLFAQGNPSGFIDGRQYLNLRSRLSHFAVDAEDPAVGKVMRNMRDALDNSMEKVVSTYYPQDTGAFRRAREAYQNNMIVNKAMGSAGAEAANYDLSPATLAKASRSVLGNDVFGAEAHPLARLARAGQQIIKELPDYTPTGLTHNFHLASTLGGGAALGGLASKLMEGAATTHDSSALGYLLGAAIPAIAYGPRAVTGELMKSALGRKYLGNQVLPTETRRALTRDPASAAMLAEALARKRPQQQEP